MLSLSIARFTTVLISSLIFGHAAIAATLGPETPVIDLRAAAPAAGEGVTLLKPAGDAIEDLIPATTAELRSEARARIALYASDRAGAQSSASPATGSIMRQKKVCNVAPRHEPPRENNASVPAPKSPGDDATEPVPGN